MKIKYVVALIVVGCVFWLVQCCLIAVRVLSVPRAHVRSPDVEIGYVYKAEKSLLEGQPRAALEQLTHTKVLRTYRGCYITLIRCSAYCMIEGNCKDVIGEADVTDFTTMIHDCPDLKDKLLRYCKAIKRYRGAGAAAELMDAALLFDGWLSPCSDLQLARAQYRFEGGDSPQAANLCQRLWDDGSSNSWDWSYVDDDRAFKSRLQALRDKVGEGREQWLKGREIRPFPQRYSIYLQPLGTIGSNTVQGVRERIEDFFGAKTTVLPTLPLTHQEWYYQKDRSRYDAAFLLEEMAKLTQVPDDAFAVVMITQDKMGASSHGWIYSTSDANLHLISSYPWSSWSRPSQVVTIGNAAISDIIHQLNIRGLFPCISCSSGDTDAKRRVRLGFSPEVQGQYRACNLEVVGRISVEGLRKRGILVVPARREGVESAHRTEGKAGE